jgi:hypothetical protein
MKTKARENSPADGSTKPLRLELKYCERCGGLWLRPTGGGQVYCAACGLAMAELPPASTERESVRGARGVGRNSGSDNFDSWGEDERLDVDAAGGVE